MKKYLMNKNVEHNGKLYAKGSEIKKGDSGFEDIVKAGHAQELSFSSGEDEKSEEPKQEEQSAEQEQPVKKSRR